MKNISKLRKADVFITAAILCAALFIYLFSASGSNATAVISVDGEVIRTIDLSRSSDNEKLTLDNGVTIEVSDGCIYFLESDCSGKDCIACGRLSSPGATAVCIPNRTVIKLTGKDSGTFDAVAY